MAEAWISRNGGELEADFRSFLQLHLPFGVGGD